MLSAVDYISCLICIVQMTSTDKSFFDAILQEVEVGIIKVCDLAWFTSVLGREREVEGGL